MSKPLSGLAVRDGAEKLGRAGFDTAVTFTILWWLLGHFGLLR